MPLADLAKEIWGIIKSLFSPRGQVIILLLVFFAVGTFLLKHNGIPTSELLIPSLFVVVIVLYSAFEFRNKWLLLLGTVMLIAWSGWSYAEGTKDGRQVRRLMVQGANLRKSADSDGSLKKYEEARLAAQKNKLPNEEMDCLYELGDIKYLMSDYKGAKSDLQNCEQLAIQLNLAGKKAYALSRLGDIARYSGDTGLAGRLLSEALQAFIQVRDIKGQAVAYRGLGDVELKRNTTISRQHFEKARQLSVQVQDQLGEADALGGLADLNSLVGHTEEARNHYTKALAIYQQLGETDGQGDIYRGMGDLNRHLGSLDVAENCYSDSLSAYQRANDKGGQADAYRGIGDCAQIKSLPDRARAKYDLALRLFQEVGDLNGQAQVQLGLGELELQTNKEAAKRFYVDAYNVYLDTQSKEGQGTSLRHWGDLEVTQDQPDPARQHYQQALDAYKDVGNQIGQAEVFKSLGDLETKLSNLDAARSNYHFAFDLYEKAEDLYGVAQIQKVLGDLETIASSKTPAMQSEKIKEAQRYYESALETYRKTNSKLGQAVTLQSKAIVDQKANNDASARENREKASALYSDIGIPKPAPLSTPNRLTYENRLIQLANKQ
jgi:tetratricopeptide (TPR) repeat protein